MLAPCMTVLSTSKNAAAVGSAGVSRAVSTSAAAAAASPARVDRCCRFERSAARLGGGSHGQRRPLRDAPGAGRVEGSPACLRSTTSPSWWPRRPRSAPDAPGPRRGRRAHADLGRARGRGRPDRHRPRRGRHRRRPPGDDRASATGSSSSRPTSACCGPRSSPSRSTRGRRAGELARMIADSGARLVVADADDRPRVRAAVTRALAGVAELDADVGRGRPCRRDRASASPARGRASPTTTSARTSHGRCRRCRTPRSWPRCSTPAAPPAARAPRCSPTGRCWPTSSRSPPVEPPMMHGDDVVLGVLRSSTSTASTPCSAACCATAPGWCWSSGSTRRRRST